MVYDLAIIIGIFIGIIIATKILGNRKMRNIFINDEIENKLKNSNILDSLRYEGESKPDKFVKMQKDTEVSNSLTDVFYPNKSLQSEPSVLRKVLFEKRKKRDFFK